MTEQDKSKFKEILTELDDESLANVSGGTNEAGDPIELPDNEALIPTVISTF